VRFVIRTQTGCNIGRLYFPCPPQPKRESIMKFLIDRLFGDVERMFDDRWVVIWLIDDL